MEAGDRMLYRAQSVDGMVTNLGGKALRDECREALLRLPGERLRAGDAVLTNGCGVLEYEHIVHTNPPYAATNPRWEVLLGACYQFAITTLRQHRLTSVATPLLGTGHRGIDLRDGARVAARALRSLPDLGEMTVCMVTVTDASTEAVEKALDREFTT
jgi:O-acetyl-ADP-ribose deacetylase (regulator of RNase III)